MAKEQILIFIADLDTGQSLERNALRPAGYEVALVREFQAFEKLARSAAPGTAAPNAGAPNLIILGDRLPGREEGSEISGLEVAASLLQQRPDLPVVLVVSQHSDTLMLEAMRIGIADYLRLPVRSGEVLQAVQRALQRREKIEAWRRGEVKRNTRSLQQRLDSLEALQALGRAVTSSLDLDSILAAVVDAAVELTGAEEGSLLLLDDVTGELYMRAARNFRDDFVRTFRVPVNDTLAGEVMRTCKPITLDAATPKKIKTDYRVQNLIYVPLLVKERAIGVLGVDNRQGRHPFSEYHLGLVTALAGYAAIAIQNAWLYSRSEIERGKLETILTRVADGVVVVGTDGRLVLVNQTARRAFAIKNEANLVGRLVRDVIYAPDLLEILAYGDASAPYRSEIALEDGRVFNAQVTPIPEVGLAVILQDITHLKELDRIKSDFVNTVSHDLRSPLTAILGYVELIERVGPISDQQVEFIRRIELSVQNITALINDLLDLGRIEAGFDVHKEIVPLRTLVYYIIDSLRPRIEEKALQLEVDVPEQLPSILGNPIRMRQMLMNLVGNALKYTQSGGEICISARSQAGQIILQISDNGPGIPLADQPYIFDKFYRASNVAGAVGTGLGLAIVKSIVENHQGRIWVDSTPGHGSKFTVVLPAVDRDL
jgi:two-component system NtrC family sensor kinase